MRLEKHIAASACVGVGVFIVTRSVIMSIAALAAGILIDVDHLYDYWQSHSFDLNLSKFFKVCIECDLVQTKLFLHSIEFLLLMAVAAFVTRSGLVTGLTLGICQHLAFDQMSNKVHPESYSFIYRWTNSFKAEMVFTNIRASR